MPTFTTALVSRSALGVLVLRAHHIGLLLIAFVLAGCGSSGTTIGTAQAPQPLPTSSGSAGAATPGAAPGASATPAAGSTAASSPTASPAGASSPSALPTGGGALCLPVTPVASPAAPQKLRFGIDVGLAGNLTPVSATTPEPIDMAKEAAPLAGLRPPHGALVVRLNRLFWSGGEPLLQQFAMQANAYAQAGYDVEIQVRYQPPTGDVDDIAGWVAYVRHAVDVLGANPHLVALTITNEVNFNVSPNTSDGFYPGANDALIAGIVAAADEAQKDGYGRRISMGFTFAYRLNPATDVGLFTYIAQHGGAAFASALGFVGLDDYPGTVYPPAFPPGDSAAAEIADAIATMRTCYLPMGGIPNSVPLWITENGFSSANGKDAAQADALGGMVDAVRTYGGTYNVTDYRWFNFRDNTSSGSGTFDQDGLLRDDYTRKPSYTTLQQAIEADS